MRVANNILELIGNTPVIKLKKVSNEDSAEIFAKHEGFNPMGSVKDRTALSMIEKAENEGKIKPGDTLVEPTSGNTGIGLAYIAAYKEYRLVLTMPETMSIERKKTLKALGAEIVLTEGSKGMKGAVEKSEELAAAYGWFQLRQFENPSNPQIHRKTTALEILAQVPDLDAFVAAVGTGGTITGAGEVIRERITNKHVLIAAVEPEASSLLSGGQEGQHGIQGIGAGFIPKILNTAIYDEIIKVSEQNAIQTARNLAKKEGIFVGISAGAATWAALQVAKKLGKGKKIVVILPDNGERYLSTNLFDY